MVTYVIFIIKGILTYLPVYLITPALLPHLCATGIELTVGRGMEWYVLMDNEGVIS